MNPGDPCRDPGTVPMRRQRQWCTERDVCNARSVVVIGPQSIRYSRLIKRHGGGHELVSRERSIALSERAATKLLVGIFISMPVPTSDTFSPGIAMTKSMDGPRKHPSDYEGQRLDGT